jgi:hypothetical protein
MCRVCRTVDDRLPGQTCTAGRGIVLGTDRVDQEEVEMSPLRRDKAVSDAIAVYVVWREACHRVDDAYAAWVRTRERRAVAFRAYVDALDDEQRAAEAYAGRLAAA